MLAIAANYPYNKEKTKDEEKMGREIEIKLEVTDPGSLEMVLADPAIKNSLGVFQTIPMTTVYYDTEDYSLSRKHWTLRLRQEGELSVATLKLPMGGRGGFSIRGEWECEAATIEQAIPLLQEAGAPPVLPSLLDGKPLIPVCGAQFTRKAALLTLSDGTQAELAIDTGVLSGNGRIAQFCELELELKSGEESAMRQLADYLARTYQLAGQPLSKHARASNL